MDQVLRVRRLGTESCLARVGLDDDRRYKVKKLTKRSQEMRGPVPLRLIVALRKLSSLKLEPTVLRLVLAWDRSLEERPAGWTWSWEY